MKPLWQLLLLTTATLVSVVECRPQGAVTLVTTTNKSPPLAPPPPPPSEDLEEDEQETKNIISEFSIRSDIQFRYAHTVVESYVKNPSSEAQTLYFSMILPDKAFISNFSMILNDEEFVARVETKEDAKSEFDAAVSSGQGAGLVEQDARDANQVTVSANVEPGGKVRFRLTYEELLQRRLSRYEHVLHVNPGQIVPDFRVDIYINESLPVVDVKVPEIKSDPNAITSTQPNPFAAIQQDPEDDHKVHVTFKPNPEQQEAMGESGVAGQFIVQYDVDRKNEDGDVQVIDGYFVHFFSPEKLETLPKHIVFVLDLSGSMFGDKIQQTKDAMVTIIDDLTEQDHFNILTFSDRVKHWTPEAELLKEGEHNRTYPGTDAIKNEALRFVLSLETGGGTNINQGMLDGLQLVEEVTQSEQLAGNVRPIVIFLTDGQATSGVTGDKEIRENVAEKNKELQAPIYGLAFGRGADFSLIKAISEESSAFARKIYEGSDAAIQLEDFYLEIASPLLSDLNIHYVGELVDEDSVTKSSLGAFNKGNELVIAGKIRDSTENEVQELDIMIAGKDKGGDYQRNFQICLPRPEPRPLPIIVDDEVESVDELPSPSFVTPVLPPILPFPDRCIPLPPRPVEPRSDAQNFVERLWAFLTIKDLLDDKQSRLEERKEELEEESEEESEESTEEPEDEEDGEDEKEPTNRDKALEIALKYNFVTELTSLVVTRPNNTNTTSEEPVEDIIVPVPVALSGVVENHHIFRSPNFHSGGLRFSSPARAGAGAGGGCPSCFSASAPVSKICKFYQRLNISFSFPAAQIFFDLPRSTKTSFSFSAVFDRGLGLLP